MALGSNLISSFAASTMVRASGSLEQKHDPREKALVSMHIRGEHRAAFESALAAAGWAIENAEKPDPYARGTNRTFSRVGVESGARWSILQVPDWILDDCGKVGWLNDVSYFLKGEAVRLISPGLEAPDPALDTLLDTWRSDPRIESRIDGRFVPWKYVHQMTKSEIEPALALKINPDEIKSDAHPNRKPHAMTPKREGAFISYAHKDKDLLEEFNTYLAVLRKKHHIWDDRQIKTGEKWGEEIEEALAKAKVAVLLVSDQFLASDFITKNELPPLLEAAEKEGLTIFSVHIGRSLFDLSELAAFQSANNPDEPLDEIPEGIARRRIYQDIARKLNEALNTPDDNSA